MAAALCFLVNFGWLHFIVADHPDWGNRLLDRVIQAASVGVAFWGIAITLLVGMESKPIISDLKRIGYLRLMVQYFSEALFVTFLLLVISVFLEPLSKEFSGLALTSLWLAAGAWALFATLRSYVALAKTLSRMT